ncbi:cobalt/nickel transport system ATP-binding protein [Amycolatopsis sulphurea]|uniref:ABC transporter ATP-binding protein n=1 Tax=Amycolatopsis sulphurea TaxID=76022 RepID=A0A2A9G273_9PSEU|nr:ABC transporter ATP-binding protein [Amycolatopsis sulphurea]PFG56962.1 cobalt/nickel transport system ATP-binding protein [Amycolatopsis sulphurea]
MAGPVTAEVALEARGLTAGYPGAPRVLRDVALRIDRGVRLALMGANGSGKSTLLRCLSGALRPDAGEIVADGAVLRRGKRALTGHRQYVQLVLQDPDDQLFAADVVQDVSFGPVNLGLGPDEVAARVEEVLAALGISALAGRPVHHLSFGQRKRVALAGALAMRPAVLLLDEPTAGLDPRGVTALLRTLDALGAAGTTVVMATHDADLVWRWADQVAVLVGHGLRQGDPAQLLGDPDVLAPAGLEPPWQVRLLREAGAPPASGADRPREPADVLARLRVFATGDGA